MNFREAEYRALGLATRWLDEAHARHAYEFALCYSSDARYGLNPSTVSCIERHIIESDSVATAWIKARWPDTGTVQILYGSEEVCLIDANDFLAQWKNIFVPSRDDAFVLHNLSNAVLFYNHEEELEVGFRIEAR